MKLVDMQTIEATHEATSGGYIYRVTVGCTDGHIKRTRADAPLWHHGVLTEMYDATEGRFMPSLSVRDMKLSPAQIDNLLAGL